MNESEPRIADSPDLAELTRECADLRRQSTTMLLGLVVMSFTLAAFIGLQARRAGKDLEGIRTQLSQVEKFNNKDVPAILSRLSQYGQTDPEYQAILNRNGVNLVIGTNPVPGTAGPARAK